MTWGIAGVPTMREFQIAPQTEGKKGRTFRATLLASVEADLLWPGGQTVSDNSRPAWAIFGGSDQELRAFMANLSLGRKAYAPKANDYSRRKADCLEILKSSGYQVVWQREEEGSLATIFLPELFQIDPGMVDPSGARFILLPTKTWAAEQNLDVPSLVAHAKLCNYVEFTPEQLSAWAPMSYLFAAYLDRRTRCPLVADGRFYFQLMLSCLEHGLASFATPPDLYRQANSLGFGQYPRSRYHESGTTTVGLLPGLAFNANHEILDTLLAREVALFFSLQGAL
jgi:hypothetical protein